MRPASAFEPGMARRWRYLPRDRDATERAVMGLASPPMGLASPPSRPRLTPRRTRRGRRVRGGRGATSRRGEKPQNPANPQPGGRLRFRVAREIFKFFLGACNGYLAGIGGRKPRGDLVGRFRTGSRAVCRQGSALTAQTDARVNVRRASNLLPHDGLTVRPAPARSTALSASAAARPSRPLVPLFSAPRLVRQHLSHDVLLVGLAALDSARIARSRARSDLAGPTRGPERLSTSRALAARARAIPSPS